MYYDIKTHEQHEQHRTVEDVDDVNPCYGQGSDGTLHPTKYNCRSYTVHSVTPSLGTAWGTATGSARYRATSPVP